MEEEKSQKIREAFKKNKTERGPPTYGNFHMFGCFFFESFPKDEPVKTHFHPSISITV